MAGKNIRSVSGKKGVGMSAPGRPKAMGVAPPTGLPKQTMPTMFSAAAKGPAVKPKSGTKKK